MLLVYGEACDNVLGIDVDNDIVAFCIVLQINAHFLWEVREAIAVVAVTLILDIMFLL
jgi:hypothetical protein